MIGCTDLYYHHRHSYGGGASPYYQYPNYQQEQHHYYQNQQYFHQQQQQIYLNQSPPQHMVQTYNHQSSPSSFHHNPQHHQHLSNGYNESCIMENASSSRQMRNLAEKMRRDKLNSYISELALLVPMVSTSSKRIDKTSILRFAVTFLRMHNILFKGTKRQKDHLSLFKNLDFSKFVLDELEGVMLIVTATGKIVFISHTVEQVLGHQQMELLGHSLFKITCLEDHDELKKNLKPDETVDPCTSGSTASTSEGGGEDTSSSESSSSCIHSPSPGSSTSVPSDAPHRYRRSFYLRLSHRTASRSDQPQYELVHVVGHLRVPKKESSSSSCPKKHKGNKDQIINNNDIILVAMMKPYKEKRITDLSLLEASKNEYITRHLVDGRIVYTDHRISVVAGYMAEEVTGHTGFNYMHKDDVRWTMIALRQMYYRGESYGESCYRLQSRTGQFIYLRTHGYLELGEDNETVQSFVCINSVVTEKEGEELIKKMKKLFSPLIAKSDEPGITAIAKKHIHLEDFEEQDEPRSVESVYSSGELEDPCKLQEAIKGLIANIPPTSPTVSKQSSGSGSDKHQFLKIMLASKTFPSVTKQTSQHGIMPGPPVVLAKPEEENQENQQQQQTPPVAPPLRQSVIRLSMSNRSSESSDNDIPAHPAHVKRMKMEEGPVPIDSDITSHRVGVVVTQQIGTKRHHQEQLPPPSQLSSIYTQSLSPITSSHPQAQIPPHLLTEPMPYSASLVEPQPLSPATAEIFQLMNLNSLGNPATSDFRQFVSESPDDITQANEIYQDWGDHLQLNQRSLQSRLQFQENQITAIEEDLQTVDNIEGDSQLYKTIKAQHQQLSCCYKEHKEQQQELRTLQQDTLSIQQNLSGNICPIIKPYK